MRWYCNKVENIVHRGLHDSYDSGTIIVSSTERQPELPPAYLFCLTMAFLTHCLFLSLSLPLLSFLQPFHPIYLFITPFDYFFIICLLLSLSSLSGCASIVPLIDLSWATIDQPLTGTISSSLLKEWLWCPSLIDILFLWHGDGESTVVRITIWLKQEEEEWQTPLSLF